IPGDVGRPIGDIKTNVDVPDLADIVAEVVDTVQPVEREVQDNEGHWHQMRVRPYRTMDNRIDGAVVSFRDVDPMKRALSVSHRTSEFANALSDTVNISLIILDRELRIRSANRSFQETFSIGAGQTQGRYLFDLGGEWRGQGPKLRTELEKV